MSNKKIVPVILAGGSGTRLWPLSRSKYPKQFFPFFKDESLFKKTLMRLRDIDRTFFSDPIIIGNLEHKDLILRDVTNSDIKVQSIILEPASRNTAPAITIACLEILKTDTDANILVMPADHHINDAKKFEEYMISALKITNSNITIFGITPHMPHTGYGYIKVDQTDNNYLNATKFIEKPDLSNAIEFYQNGSYLWNAGIFLGKASFILSLIENEDRNLTTLSRSILENASISKNLIELDLEYYQELNSISIDYLVMENLKKNNIETKVIPLEVGWSDLGSWQSIWDLMDKDQDNNILYGDISSNNSRNSLVYSENRHIATHEINDLVVIDTKDSLLVADKSKSEDIKGLIDSMKIDHANVLTNHVSEDRPWGSFETLHEEKFFKIKKITVSPQHKLSKQSHERRSETWTVLDGEAAVTLDDREILLSVDESIHIKQGSIHRLENKGSTNLIIIEIQTGTYFGEDDIKRYEDDYGRK